MPVLFCLCFWLNAANADTDTIFLKDNTRAVVSVIDTSGGSIVVKRGNDFVKIDKKQITRHSAVHDTARTVYQTAKNPPYKKPLSVNRAIADILAGYTAQKAALQSSAGIGYLGLPIAGKGGDDKLYTEFSHTMTGFLAKNGKLRTLSKEGLYFYLSGEAVFSPDCRYCALPYEISVKAIERKMNVSSFVKLDTMGNFVPTTKGTTLKAVERETIVRFVVADLLKKTIAFDERVMDIDKGLQELDAKNANDSQNRSGKNSILRIEGKLEALLKKQIK